MPHTKSGTDLHSPAHPSRGSTAARPPNNASPPRSPSTPRPRPCRTPTTNRLTANLGSMIRKQLYITAAHDAELKARAGAALVTEAEIVRAALDAAFGFGKSQTAAQARALE